MPIEIKEIKSGNLDKSKTDEYERLSFLLNNKIITRRDFLKNILLLSSGSLLINNVVIQNEVYASFWPAVVVRFIAGQFFRGGAIRNLVEWGVKEVVGNVVTDIVVDGVKQIYRSSNERPTSISTVDHGTRYHERPTSISTVDHRTRYMAKTDNSNILESVSETINLSELFGDVIWKKNEADNPVSIIVTNYNDYSVEIPKLNMFLKDINSHNNDLSTKIENLGKVSAGSESLINLSVKDLPYTGLKKLNGDNENIYGSGKILVAKNDDVDKYIDRVTDERGMTVEELYNIFLEKNR